MQRRYNLLSIVVTLVLMLLIAAVDVQARIAFASERDGNWEIYVMDNDGGNQRRLSNNPIAEWEPSWSPDGKRIAFTSSEARRIVGVGGRHRQIYVMDNDGGNHRRLSNNPIAEWEPSWSPDGKHIAFTSSGGRSTADGHWGIYVIDADGKNLRRLSNDPVDDRGPSWSPDGKHIAFSRRRGVAWLDIYVMDTNGKNLRQLTKNPLDDTDPSWSPDGERIVFSSDREGHFRGDSGITSEIYVMDDDGKNQRRLTKNPFNDWRPSWSPDGRYIVFVSFRGGNREIYVMDDDGKNLRNLTNNPHDDADPAWYNPAFAVAPAGKKIMIWGRLKQLNR